MNEMTAEHATEMYDSLNDIIAALDAMHNSKKLWWKADYWVRCAGEAASYLRKIASGEYKPVVHGKWLNFFNDFAIAECSECRECHEISPDKKPREDYFNAFKQFYKFCPSCGALMGKDDSR
jgi:Pyruvate/2-oxoacid:ferredoxin oxidoreductase delta subunit